MQKAQLKMTVIPAFALQQKGCIVCVRVHPEGVGVEQEAVWWESETYTRWDCEQVRSLEELSDALHIGNQDFQCWRRKVQIQKGGS